MNPSTTRAWIVVPSDSGSSRVETFGNKHLFFYNLDMPPYLLLVYAKAVREFAENIEQGHRRPARTQEKMNKFSKDLIKSLGEAADHAEGRTISARLHVVEVPDVRAIRRKLHLSQQEFAQKLTEFLCRRCEIGNRGGVSRTRRQQHTFTPSLCAHARSAMLSSCNEQEGRLGSLSRRGT
jgi:hypothetical protein